MNTNDSISSFEDQILNAISPFLSIIGAIGAAALGVTVMTILWFRFAPGLVGKASGAATGDYSRASWDDEYLSHTISSGDEGGFRDSYGDWEYRADEGL